MNQSRPFPVKKYDWVFARVETVGLNQYKFKPNEQLRNKPVKGIVIVPNDYVTVTPNGDTLVSLALLKAQCFITLKTTKGVEEINKLPAFMAMAGVNSGGTYEKYYPIDNLVVDWEQSYMTSTNANPLVLNTCFMVGVVYDDGTTICDQPKK